MVILGVDNDVIMTSNRYNFLGAEFKNKDVKAGNVLISEPFLNDSNFSRTVVLITEHNEKGSFGLILNRPLNKNLADIVSGFDNVLYSIVTGKQIGRAHV